MTSTPSSESLTASRPNVTRAVKKQELSYRKQIARQLRTQYVEGIYRSNYP